ncbi:ISL3 family transposase [Bacteroidales bacterium OttesenSCG-928-I21]|nr:ISL3 family transposase [Bacteroidales bacterium OttesenSCG-928-I21]
MVDTLQSTKSQSRTADLLRVSFSQVHRVMHRSVAIGLSRRSSDERYYYLSFDEKAVHKGHDYITVLSDEQTGIVIDIIEGRSDESVDELCQRALTEEQRGDVKTVCTDMWKPYIKGAETYFPNALHCHDNFHIVGYLNKAVDKCRRREVKQHEELKRTKYLFLKDKMSFTDEQYFKFEAINKANYQVARAWQVKENFRDISFIQTPERAMTLYRMWRQDALRADIKEINQVIETFDRHEKGIVNAIHTGANNARAERLNGSIQELKTIGRGYRNTENFRIAILFFHGNLDMIPHENL